MTGVKEFLSHLRSLEIKLWAEDGDLGLRAPKGVLTLSLREELQQRKPEILEFLSRSPARQIPPLPEQEFYELSHAQRRLWILSQIDEGSAAYNIPLSLQLDGDLAPDALGQAVAALVERHESLRTSFISADKEWGEPRQSILSGLRWRLPYSDLSRNQRAEEEAYRRAYELSTAPFDLADGPLFRAELLKLSAHRHVFLFVMHHIISDGWSLSVLTRELTLLYRAFRSGASCSLPPLRIQYRDYAAWQNRLLESEAISEHRRYWSDKLSGRLPVLDLPTDLPRPARQSFRGEMFTFNLDAQLSEELSKLATNRRATLFMVLVAMVKALLHRYTGQEEILLGTPVSGRSHPDLDHQIGFYLNTLVLLDTVTPDQPFAEFLGNVRQTALEAYEHDLYPFDRLVDELQLQRDLSRSPVFDVMVILQNAGPLSLALDGVQIKPLFVETGSSKCDLTFDFAPDRTGSTKEMLVGIRYNTDLFHPDRIERMSRHFLQLIRSVLCDPSQPVGRLNILPEQERQLLLYDFNDTAAPTPKSTLVKLFEEQSRRTPDSTALSFEDHDWTYRELGGRSNQLARHLSDTVECRGNATILIGLFVERSPEMLVGLFGILKAGCAYVPLDSSYPPSRLTHMLQDSQAVVVLTQQGLLPRLSEILAPLRDKPRVICLDADWEQISANSDEPPENVIRPESLAYVLYTSGSTGKPKGVAIGHHALLNFLLSMRQRPGLSPNDVLLAVTTISFDIAGLELYLPLVTGARVVMATAKMAADGSLLAERLRRGDITVMQATPSTWRMLLAAGWEGTPRLTILCGGEGLPRDLAAALVPKCESLWNLYGPTETTIWSTAHDVSSEMRERKELSSIMSIGRPIDNTQIYILDSKQQPAPIGIAGDLYIGGSGLACGYWNRPELTAQKFCADPFSPKPGTRLYRTGDRARFLSDGRIEFLGRTDHQVKLRGFRIEIGEVESAMLQHPLVREVAVINRGDSQGEARLVAYIVSEAGELEPAVLRQHLAGHLPEYMIPSVFIRLDALPLTPNGKVDRANLPAPTQFSPARNFVAPRNDLERGMARILEEVLGVERIGIIDDFFELGGHSLKATRAVFRFQRDLQLKLTMIDIFRQPTIAGLSELAEQRGSVQLLSLTPERDSDAVTPATPEELEMLGDD